VSRTSFLLSAEVAGYARAHSTQPDEVARDLIDETALLAQAQMQVAADQGAFLGLLVAVSGARSVLEIGTFTGYSALCMARALPEGGRLVACDVSEEWTAIGRRYWERAGVADRIDLRLGPALETLQAMGPDETFDLVFIDADKQGYPAYLEEVAGRLMPGGLLLADNVLSHGEIADEAAESPRLQALRAFNDRIASHPGFETVLLAVFDGLTFARKRIDAEPGK
jgi:caffeoyl-CoA O-methyltransferase